MKLSNPIQLRRLTACLVAGLISSGLAMGAQAASFQGLGYLPGKISSAATAISADGTTVVGSSSSATGSEAFRWSQETGMVGLGYLPGHTFSDARAISADGSVIVGRSSPSSGGEAFRWTEAAGMISLGAGTAGFLSSYAYGVSGDGSKVVGYGSAKAYLWSESSGFVSLGDLDGGAFITSRAWGISADGTTVVGMASSAPQPFQPYRWSETSGMVGLGWITTGQATNQANAVSADGSVIVGESSLKAFRWSEATGIQDLGAGSFSRALAVSADGSAVVGFANTTGGAFIWDQANGVRSIEDLLTSYGLDMSGWVLSEATGISADGLTIVGKGNRSGQPTEAWIANLAPTAVPVPASMWLFGSAFAGLFGIARRRA